MADTRKKNINWRLTVNPDGRVSNLDAHLAVLMDIRDELLTLNRLLSCPSFLEIPAILRGIRLNTAKPERKAMKAKQ